MTKKMKQDPNRTILKGTFEGADIDIDGGVHVVSIHKGARADTIIVVAVRDYRGKRALDIRSYYLGSPEEVYHPTGKGVWLPAETAGMVLEDLYNQREKVAELLNEQPKGV